MTAQYGMKICLYLRKRINDSGIDTTILRNVTSKLMERLKNR